MGICKKILVLYFLFLTNFLHAEASLEATKVSVFDLILVKYDIYFEKVKSRILTKTKKAIMVHYQTVEQDISFDEENNINVIISAYMSKRRYTQLKKYFPKIIDCNIVRNRMIANKNGYSILTNKKNYSVSEEFLFNEIRENVYNLKNIDQKNIEDSIKNTNIRVNIIHPINKFSISCSGKITQLELD